MWVRVELSSRQGWALREQARNAGVPVDAWLAVMIEFSRALRALEQAGTSHAGIRAVLERELEQAPMPLAARSDWRGWQATLAGAGEPAKDELPETILPRRLVAAGLDGTAVQDALDAAADWPLARNCELHASGAEEALGEYIRGVGEEGPTRDARRTFTAGSTRMSASETRWEESRA